MSYTICARFKGENIVYAGYTICSSREHIVYGAFCGSTFCGSTKLLSFYAAVAIIYLPRTMDCFTYRTANHTIAYAYVNSEIFLRVQLLQNFTGAKFRGNKNLAK